MADGVWQSAKNHRPQESKYTRQSTEQFTASYSIWQFSESRNGQEQYLWHQRRLLAQDHLEMARIHSNERKAATPRFVRYQRAGRCCICSSSKELARGVCELWTSLNACASSTSFREIRKRLTTAGCFPIAQKRPTRFNASAPVSTPPRSKSR